MLGPHVEDVDNEWLIVEDVGSSINVHKSSQKATLHKRRLGTKACAMNGNDKLFSTPTSRRTESLSGKPTPLQAMASFWQVIGGTQQRKPRLIGNAQHHNQRMAARGAAAGALSGTRLTPAAEAVKVKQAAATLSSPAATAQCAEASASERQLNAGFEEPASSSTSDTGDSLKAAAGALLPDSAKDAQALLPDSAKEAAAIRENSEPERILDNNACPGDSSSSSSFSPAQHNLQPALLAATDSLGWVHVSSADVPPRARLLALADKANDAEFVHVTPTLAALARGRPGITSIMLWAFLVLCLLGELAVTIWWLVSLGLRGFLLLCAPLSLGLVLVLMMLSVEQVVAVALSVGMAALPALPAYSAVLLLVPPESALTGSDGCWEMLHSSTMIALAMMYLASAVLSALRAEHPSPGVILASIFTFLDTLEQKARGICLLALWVYLSITVHIIIALAWPWGPQPSNSTPWSVLSGAFTGGPLASGRGLVLSLHALGLLCYEARQRVTASFGKDLLPLLIGAQRASRLTVSSLVRVLVPSLLSRAPTLRRYTPPTAIVALIIAVRRTAPLLFPMLALLSQLARPGDRGWPRMALLLAIILTIVVGMVTRHEWQRLPRSTLRRLPLLLPSGVAPVTRKMLGYILTVAERVEKTRGGIATLAGQFLRSQTQTGKTSG